MINYNSDEATRLAREILGCTCESCRISVAMNPDAYRNRGLACAGCENDLFSLECVFEVRDYAAEGAI